MRSSNLLVRSSKSTSSPPALFPPGTLSGKLGRSVGTVGRSGKLGPDEGRGALGAGGWCGADRTKQNKTHNHIKIIHNKLGRKDRYNIKGYSLRDWVSALDSGSSGPGSLHCVLGQDTLLSWCFSPPKCINGYWQNNAEGLSCDGLASHPGGLSSSLMLQKLEYAPVV